MRIKSNIIGSIIVLLGTIMLFSCSNTMEDVRQLGDVSEMPTMSGENLYLIYSDSARVKYKIETPVYNKIEYVEEKYDEFPKGIHVISYDNAGKVVGEITSKYAKNLIDKKLWEARTEVVVINAEGARMETELLYWDMETEKIYTNSYSRLFVNGNIIEGNNGFESDQSLRNIVFKNITGEVEVQQ